MKKILLLFAVLFLGAIPSIAQDEIDLTKIEQLLIDNQKKIESAMVVMDAVQKTGNYVQSLSDLFTKEELTLPVGIKKGDYELIIQEIEYDNKIHKQKIYATCAFRLKESGQIVAFEGNAVLTGIKGLETKGALTLIAPVQRKIGKQSSLIIREGTSVEFDCEGIKSFDARMLWMVTSDKIIPVNPQGQPTGRPLSVAFDAQFKSFDDYLVSLNINQLFTFKGLDDVIFTLKGAILDQSDTETSPMTRFPENYFSPASEEIRRLWKGMAVTEASVGLPGVFKRPDVSDERIILAMQQVLFDENGFSGNLLAKDIIPGENINPEQWDISLSDIAIGFLRGNLVSFGFGGKLNIPPLGKNSLLPYIASFNPQEERYEVKAGIAGKYDFPVLCSTLTLNGLSTIDIAFKNQGVYPTINASGKLTVNAPLGKDSIKTFSVPDIDFENLIISRESPYLEIGYIGVTGNLRTPKLGGFELSISDIKSFKNDRGSGLTFSTGVAVGDMFSGITSIQLYGDYQNWKFKEVFVDRVNVAYYSSAFSIAGGVWFKNSDLVYGNGFRGDVRLSVLNKFDFDAIGVFGEKDNNKYFLTDAFFELAPPAGILVPPVLNFYGFGGGLYRHMQQSSKNPASLTETADLDFGKSLSGISYLPDENVGMGFMANTKFAMVASSSLFNAKVGLEMQFNKSGGLNFAQFRGDASFMDNVSKWGKLSDNMDVSQTGKVTKADIRDKLPENKNSGFLTASLLIEYDNINKIFSADMGTYLDAGIIRGIGPNNKLGMASAYFSPDSWHAYLGTPSDRLGIEALGLAKLSGYFMLGDGIPELPRPPERVLRNLSADKQASLTRNDNGKLTSGKGIAFGAAFETQFDASLAMFYAHLGVGLGAEFMLTDLNGITCANYSGTPGINGWYAQAQAWAYVEAAIGIRARVFGRRRNFSILDLSVGTLLKGAGPNPIYFAGAVGGKFRVMGGLIKGNCNFDFEIGEKCIIKSDSPFDEEVIAQLMPAKGASDVNVFAAPQVIFNMPIEENITINEEGSKGIYKVTLEECVAKYKDTGIAITGHSKFSSDNTVYVLTPNEPLESRKDVEMIAKVSFQKLINNQWVYVKGDDGKPVFESKTTAFHTGDRPKEILPEHVKYSYPMDKQYNFYSQEHNRGYILVTQNYSYLFSTEKPEGFDQKIRIGDGNGKPVEKPFTYTTSNTGNDIRMEIDFGLDQIAWDKNKIYTLSILNIPQAANADIKSNITTVETAVADNPDITVSRQQATETLTQLSEKTIYSLHFRSSQYDKFTDKIQAFNKKEEGWRDYVEPFVHHIKTNLKQAEFFDAYEILGVRDTLPLIRFEAEVNSTNWYTQTFYRNMYQSQNQITVPASKVEIVTQHPEKLVSDDEIQSGIVSGFGADQGIFRYALPYWCSRDFFAVKKEIAQRALRGQATQQEIDLMNTDFPPVVHQGNYPVKVSYVLPGKDEITSTTAMIMYNPVTP
ncbi:hypothetical protein [Viscerimonas tarda]